MATYTELFSLINHNDLHNRLAVAVAIAADGVRTDGAAPANQAARLAWAKEATQNPQSMADRMFWQLVAQNEGVTLATITGASDAELLTAVQASIDLFADN